nr:G protein-coupled receptor [Proales similis]
MFLNGNPVNQDYLPCAFNYLNVKLGNLTTRPAYSSMDVNRMEYAEDGYFHFYEYALERPKEGSCCSNCSRDSQVTQQLIFQELLNLSSIYSLESVATVLGMNPNRLQGVINCFGELIPVLSLDKRPTLNPTLKAFFQFLMVIQLVVSVAGNSVILIFLGPIKFKLSRNWRHNSTDVKKNLVDKRTIKITHVLFWFSALFDLIFSISVLPLQFISVTNDGHWILSDLWCKIYAYMTYAVLTFTSFSMVAISVHRFVAIFLDARHTPLRPRASKSIQLVKQFLSANVYLILAAIIGCSLLFSLPYLLYTQKWQLQIGPTCLHLSDHFICANSLAQQGIGLDLGYKISFVVMVCILPGLVLSLLYGLISYKIFFKKNMVCERNARNQFRKRIVKILVSDCLFYIICWFPLAFWVIIASTNDIYHWFRPDTDLELSIVYFLYLSCFTNVSFKWVFRVFSYWSKLRLDIAQLISLLQTNYFKVSSAISPANSTGLSQDLSAAKAADLSQTTKTTNGKNIRSVFTVNTN